MSDLNVPIDAADFDTIERPESPYAELSDRALMERIALQLDTTTAIANAVMTEMSAKLGPLLDDPKLKLMLKFLPKGL